jgi:hypothetical protein
MSITSIHLDFVGQTDVHPRVGRIVSTDNLATITAAGYLNAQANGAVFYPSDMLAIKYSGGEGWFTLSFGANNIITLIDSSSTIAIPTIANHIAVYTNTSGGLGEDAATAINGGNIQAGLSGTAGSLASFPATSAKGSFVIQGVANTGNTTTTLSNAPMGQQTTITIPDPGASAANVLLDHATNTLAAGASIVANKVNGTEATNAVTASGMSGVITTSSLTTVGGSSYAITWTNTFITGTSTVLLSIQGGTNTTENITLKVVPGSGTATLTIYNNTAATALNGTIFIGYLVI